MKNQPTSQVDTTVNFLLERQQFTNLTPLESAANLGYVWKRVFLKGRAQRA